MDKRIIIFIENSLRSELHIELSDLKKQFGDTVVEMLLAIVRENEISHLDFDDTEKFIEIALENIIGYPVNKEDGNYKYISKGVSKRVTKDMICQGLEVKIYVTLSHQIAQWYVENVAMYCEQTLEDIRANDGKAVATSRIAFRCDLSGNLNGLDVMDDCSGYIWATMVQAGYFTNDTPKYTSSSYLTGGSAEKRMQEAGFTWYPMSQLSGDELKQGDILVKDGHIEIFYDYLDGRERALTWGSVYTEEPVTKWATVNNISHEYRGVWRKDICAE